MSSVLSVAVSVSFFCFSLLALGLLVTFLLPAMVTRTVGRMSNSIEIGKMLELTKPPTKFLLLPYYGLLSQTNSPLFLAHFYIVNFSRPF